MIQPKEFSKKKLMTENMCSRNMSIVTNSENKKISAKYPFIQENTQGSSTTIFTLPQELLLFIFCLVGTKCFKFLFSFSTKKKRSLSDLKIIHKVIITMTNFLKLFLGF